MELNEEKLEELRKEILGRVLSMLVNEPMERNVRTLGKVLLRPAVSDDLADLVCLYDETGGLQDGSEESTAEMVFDYHRTMRTTMCIARSEENNELLGMGSIDWSAIQFRTGLMVNLLISNSARRCGLGQALVSYREHLLRRFKCSESHAMIKLTNKNTQSLYKKLGYIQIFDGAKWSRPPFLEWPEQDVTLLDDCSIFAKVL